VRPDRAVDRARGARAELVDYLVAVDLHAAIIGEA
jgi:hypothetical protein